MTASRDPDRLIQAFLSEGEELLSDSIYDAVRAEIEQTRQRAGFGWWRTPIMSKIVPIGLGAAAVLVIGLLLGYQLLGTPGNVGGPDVEPTATPAVTDTPEPSIEPTSSADAFLPEGPHLVEDAGALAGSPSTTVTIPAPGWTAIPAFGGLLKGLDEDPPQAAMLLWSWPVGTSFDVYGDPCKWASTRPDTPATTVEEIAAALAAQTSRDGSDPVDVTVGPFTGKKVTLHVPEDWNRSSNDCDQKTFASYGTNGGEPERYHQGPGQVDELWILNVNQAVVILDVMYRPDTPAALIDEMRTIVESATFAW